MNNNILIDKLNNLDKFYTNSLKNNNIIQVFNIQ